MAKFWKSKTILAKSEVTYGVDPTPTGALNAILASDVTFTPMEADWLTRNVERRYMGAQPGIPTSFRSTLSMSVELVGSGTPGTPPGWDALIRACAAARVITANTSVEYSPVTNGHESAALYFDVDGTLYKMLGTRGTAVLTVNAAGIPVIAFTLTSLFTMPAEQPRLTPDYSAFRAPQAANKANTPTFTIGGTPFIMRSFSLTMNNDVQSRFLVGQEEILIVDRNEEVAVQVEAKVLTAYNPYALAQSGDLQAIVLVHGNVAGRITRVDLPRAQQQQPGFTQEQNIVEWPLTFSPQPNAGDDQWKITLT